MDVNGSGSGTGNGNPGILCNFVRIREGILSCVCMVSCGILSYM